MEPPGGIDEQDVRMAGLCRLDGIVDHCRRVGAFLMFDDLHTAALGPDLQLLDGGSPEGVGSADQDLLALGFEIRRQLPDGGGLPGAVHADDKDDGRAGGELHGLVLPEHIRYDLLQKPLDLSRIGDAGLLDLPPQLVADVLGGNGPHIGHDKDFFQFLQKVLVDLREGVDDPLHLTHHGVFCLFEPFPDLAKKSHFGSSLSL